MFNFFSKIKVSLCLVVLFFLTALPIISDASYDGKVENKEYPRIANYFLAWSLSNKDVNELARWDVLILDMDNQVNNKGKLEKLREINPDIIILAYISSQEIIDKRSSSHLRNKLLSKIDDDWYLHDEDGNKLSFWENTNLLNVTNFAEWNKVLPEFVSQEVLSSNLWDGVFYDSVWDSISWFNNGNIDADNNGKRDNLNELNRKWKNGMLEILRVTRQDNDNCFIVANLASNIEYHNYLNGRMFESFPSPWEGSGTWESSMEQYLQVLPEKSQEPQIYIINSNTDNIGVMDNYRKMRFGLASALLGDGFYSFDFGDKSHAQIWWYDEYETTLGKVQSQAYNLLDKDNFKIKPGLWRRNFENGVAIVNSTDKEQTYVFSKENLEKIDGQQDRRVNNGAKINWIRIASEDGVVLLKINTEIINDVYNNGNFIRIFDFNGKQKRNGFFAFKDAYSGNVEILVSDIDSDNSLETLVNGKGLISIYDNGEKVTSFYPYTERFKKDISFAVSDINNDGEKEIITGAGPGGGPHVRVFNKDGVLISTGFFAYNKNFRGGISFAVSDINNDGEKEIITGAGPGGGPHVRVFTINGELINQFFAYNKNFRGGISIAVSDINNDGEKEIITGLGKGGQTRVRVFTQYGELLYEFFAYENKPDISIEVIANDIDNDDIDEILVSTNSF